MPRQGDIEAQSVWRAAERRSALVGVADAPFASVAPPYSLPLLAFALLLGDVQAEAGA